MTEASYQEGRKVMQKANAARSFIYIKKGNVAKWTKIEATYIENLQPTRAAGARKCLETALIELDKARKKFTDIKFPPNDIVEAHLSKRQCENCGDMIDKGKNFCEACLK